VKKIKGQEGVDKITAQLLGYIIIRKTDGKRMAYIGVIPMKDKKTANEWSRVYPASKYHWVYSLQINAPKTSKYKCR